eukprot:GHVU01157612.1.p1 GENE.GHVU01157612.1~~GHVU01157612.1.p1  ORF type:complete len:441 (+),score=79.75 GHVU01157612.1:109-1323(+)
MSPQDLAAAVVRWEKLQGGSPCGATASHGGPPLSRTRPVRLDTLAHALIRLTAVDSSAGAHLSSVVDMDIHSAALRSLLGSSLLVLRFLWRGGRVFVQDEVDAFARAVGELLIPAAYAESRASRVRQMMIEERQQQEQQEQGTRGRLGGATTSKHHRDFASLRAPRVDFDSFVVLTLDAVVLLLDLGFAREALHALDAVRRTQTTIDHPRSSENPGGASAAEGGAGGGAGREGGAGGGAYRGGGAGGGAGREGSTAGGSTEGTGEPESAATGRRLLSVEQFLRLVGRLDVWCALAATALQDPRTGQPGRGQEEDTERRCRREKRAAASAVLSWLRREAGQLPRGGAATARRDSDSPDKRFDSRQRHRPTGRSGLRGAPGRGPVPSWAFGVPGEGTTAGESAGRR